MKTLLGYRKAELHGQPFLSFVCQEDITAAWGQFEDGEGDGKRSRA